MLFRPPKTGLDSQAPSHAWSSVAEAVVELLSVHSLELQESGMVLICPASAHVYLQQCTEKLFSRGISHPVIPRGHKAHLCHSHWLGSVRKAEGLDKVAN